MGTAVSHQISRSSLWRQAAAERGVIVFLSLSDLAPFDADLRQQREFPPVYGRQRASRHASNE